MNKPKIPNTIIVCDFDGTIIYKDSIDELLKCHSIDNKWEMYEKLWVGGKIDEYICLKNQMNSIRIDQSGFRLFLLKLTLRNGFVQFINFCKINFIPVIIISDGFETTISKLLKLNDLKIPLIANDIKFISKNKITFNPRKRLIRNNGKLIYLHKDDIVRKIKENSKRIIYIGDGTSDIKAINHADIVFARSSLKKYCKKNNISFFDFKSFYDIIHLLKIILDL